MGMKRADQAEASRISWVDNVKVIACVLVALGHFFPSMVLSGIAKENAVYNWFQSTIYYFHVPLFFAMSGYMAHKQKRPGGAGNWLAGIGNKCISLGVPYFVFSCATFLMKWAAADGVNRAVENGLLNSLFVNPISPYWYLYALFFLFILMPPVKSRNAVLAVLTISAGAWFGVALAAGRIPYCTEIVGGNAVWFALGMGVSAFSWEKRFGRVTNIAGALFIPGSVAVFWLQMDFAGLPLLMGLWGCLFVMSVTYTIFRARKQAALFRFLAEYTMPVFLMHTIFAAGTRIVLLKLGIASGPVHFALGLCASFAGPILAMWIMRKTKYPAFIIYPSRFVRIPYVGKR